MGKEFLDAFETHKLGNIKTSGIILNVDKQTDWHTNKGQIGLTNYYRDNHH